MKMNYFIVYIAIIGIILDFRFVLPNAWAIRNSTDKPPYVWVIYCNTDAKKIVENLRRAQ